jgi:peptide/nickel transport system substrate-binding protein
MLVVLGLVLLAFACRLEASGPEGQMTWAVPFALAPTFFEPAEASGLIAPFIMYYALHDALVKPMPGQAIAPGVAESWSAAPDGLAYEFVLRKNVRFPHRRPPHRRGREVLVRALSWRRRPAASRRAWPPSTSSILTACASS